MIYLYYGNEYSIIESANALIESLLKKKPDASVFKYDDETWSRSDWEEKIEAQGLFVDHCIIQAKRICSNKEAKEHLTNWIESIAESPNVFIFIENELPKNTLNLFKKYAEKVVERTGSEVEEEKKHNVFTVTDAIGKRDRKKAWVELEKALMAGLSPEEIHSIIFWQFKNMLLVKNTTKSPDTLGIKPYPFRKAVQFSQNFTLTELKNLSSRLVRIFHESRFGNKELGIELESFVLSI